LDVNCLSSPFLVSKNITRSCTEPQLIMLAAEALSIGSCRNCAAANSHR
jgi:hypothetical protein